MIDKEKINYHSPEDSMFIKDYHFEKSTNKLLFCCQFSNQIIIFQIKDQILDVIKVIK